MIDGYQVLLGDTVWVVGMGTATVAKVEANGDFQIRSGSGMLAITKGGYLGKVRKVYWHDPLIIPPPKDVYVWHTFKKVAITVFNVLARAFQIKGVPDEEGSEEDS